MNRNIDLTVVDMCYTQTHEQGLDYKLCAVQFPVKFSWRNSASYLPGTLFALALRT